MIIKFPRWNSRISDGLTTGMRCPSVTVQPFVVDFVQSRRAVYITRNNQKRCRVRAYQTCRSKAPSRNVSSCVSLRCHFSAGDESFHGFDMTGRHEVSIAIPLMQQRSAVKRRRACCGNTLSTRCDQVWVGHPAFGGETNLLQLTESNRRSRLDGCRDRLVAF